VPCTLNQYAIYKNGCGSLRFLRARSEAFSLQGRNHRVTLGCGVLCAECFKREHRGKATLDKKQIRCEARARVYRGMLKHVFGCGRNKKSKKWTPNRFPIDKWRAPHSAFE
jgi:hypothetical protein